MIVNGIDNGYGAGGIKISVNKICYKLLVS